MSNLCNQHVFQLIKIQAIQTQLADEADKFSDYQTLDRKAQIDKFIGFFKLRSEIRSLIKEVKENLNEYSFVVKNAVNPYAEALKEGGITDLRLIAETKDIKVDLQEILKQEYTAYKSAGCDIWADALPENIKDLNLTKEHLETIKNRIELGEIPIVMPGRLAQLNGLMQAIEKLKPKLIKDGQEQAVADTYHWDYIDKLIEIMKEIAIKLTIGRNWHPTEIAQLKKKLDPLVKDKNNAIQQLIKEVTALPERPYIFTASTSQQNEARTRNKILADQLKELATIQDENKEINLVVQSIGECLALQNRFTERTQQQAGARLNTLNPLDDYNRSGGTFSRIIDLPVSSGGSVPSGRWSSDRSRVYLAGDVELASSGGGFRVSVRV